MNRGNNIADTTYGEPEPDSESSIITDQSDKWMPDAGPVKGAVGQDDSEVAIKRIAQRYKSMDLECEQRLIKLASSGDKLAADELIRHFMKLISGYAARHAKNRVGLEYADLVQQGSLGFLKAINNFDCTRRIRLELCEVVDTKFNF